MIRIAIATAAVTMLVGPLVALSVAPASEASSVSRDLAVATAKAEGIAHLSGVAFKNGMWVVSGADVDGVKLAIGVSGAGKVMLPTAD